MTEAMKFFQSLLIFQSFMPLRMKSGDVKLANELADEARRLAAREAQNGAAAQTAVLNANITKNKKLSQNLATIAVWHYERAAAKYSAAAERFEAAAGLKIRARYREHFGKKAGEMAKRAAQAAVNNNSLNDSLNQKEN